MLFVVGTHSFLVLVELDEQWQVAEFEVLATGHHYGIALPKLDGTQFIAKSVRAKSGMRITTYKRESSRRVGTYSQIDSFVLDEDFRAVHQIAFLDNGLYIANTNYNSLDYLSLNGAKRQRYFFDGINYDQNHVNSVFPCGDNQVLALLHNRGRQYSELAVLQRNAQSEFKLVRRIPIWHKGSHNIFMDEVLLVYNASGVGDFVAVDLETERVVQRIRFPGHTKGLSVTQKYFIIGYSDNAQREARFTSRGHMAIIDRQNLEVVAIVDLNHPSLPHPIGNVNEVRCLSELEYGHSRPTPLDIDWRRLKLSAGDWHHQIRLKLGLPISLLRFIWRSLLSIKSCA